MQKERIDVDSRYEKCNIVEKEFIGWALTKENVEAVHRGGWPDFLIQTRDNRIVGVEVKRLRRDLSLSQIQCFRLLEKAGVPVYVWRISAGLERWTEHVQARSPADGGSLQLGPQASHKNAASEADDGHAAAATLGKGEQRPDELTASRDPSEPVH